MKRRLTTLIVCAGVGLLASGCVATRNFVREQLGTTEGRLTQRADTQEQHLRQTADRTEANTQALSATGERIQGLDSRVGAVDARVGQVDGRVNEVSALAGETRREVASVAEALRETDTRFTQRFANRNKYSPIDTKAIYFDFAKADLRDEGINELEEVAKALKADPNAVLEVQGFADPRGSDKYNFQLSRERVDSVIRYLVQRHGIDLRRLHAVGMGKVATAAGEKADKDAFAKARRVEIRVMSPQS